MCSRFAARFRLEERNRVGGGGCGPARVRPARERSEIREKGPTPWACGGPARPPHGARLGNDAWEEGSARPRSGDYSRNTSPLERARSCRESTACREGWRRPPAPLRLFRLLLRHFLPSVLNLPGPTRRTALARFQLVTSTSRSASRLRHRPSLHAPPRAPTAPARPATTCSLSFPTRPAL